MTEQWVDKTNDNIVTITPSPMGGATVANAITSLVFTEKQLESFRESMVKWGWTKLPEKQDGDMTKT